jgi:hypothetical protein
MAGAFERLGPVEFLFGVHRDDEPLAKTGGKADACLGQGWGGDPRRGLVALFRTRTPGWHDG